MLHTVCLFLVFAVLEARFAELQTCGEFEPKSSAYKVTLRQYLLDMARQQHYNSMHINCKVHKRQTPLFRECVGPTLKIREVPYGCMLPSSGADNLLVAGRATWFAGSPVPCFRLLLKFPSFSLCVFFYRAWG